MLFGLGSAAAVAVLGSRFDRLAYAVGQGAITCIQLMTHYANDYFDLGADQANTTPTRWSGGSRVLPGGLVSPHLALRAARLFGALAALLVALMVLRAVGRAQAIRGARRAASPRSMAITVVAAAVLILAALLAWFYSAPPLALHSRGLGEVTTALVVTGLTPLAGFLLQARRWVGRGAGLGGSRGGAVAVGGAAVRDVAGHRVSRRRRRCRRRQAHAGGAPRWAARGGPVSGRPGGGVRRPAAVPGGGCASARDGGGRRHGSAGGVAVLASGAGGMEQRASLGRSGLLRGGDIGGHGGLELAAFLWIIEWIIE